MNVVTLTGILAGDSELRRIESGRDLLNFDVYVEGRKGEDPCVHIAFFPRTDNDPREIKAGCRIMVVGAIRHRRDTGLFVAASELLIFA
ncbi:MAG: hypothetical protein ABR973_12455 [Candidatus Acidiferrales bacterium]|jgi:hypothetical protein